MENPGSCLYEILVDLYSDLILKELHVNSEDSY